MTQGFSIDEEEDGGAPPPPTRGRVRTRSEVMNGESRRAPSKVKTDLLAHNPFNPREELTELEETAESLRQKGQLQRLAVVTREAFLKTHPGQEEAIAGAQYVVIDGNRRLAAAKLADLETLRIDVNDELASSAADLTEAALIANVHRVDVPPLEQAKALQGLVEVHGSQRQVALRLGKTPAWVSQRLSLLNLTPELQEEVEAGKLRVEPARRIGRLPKEEQAKAAEGVNAVNAPRRPRRSAESGEAPPEGVNDVNTRVQSTVDASPSSRAATAQSHAGTDHVDQDGNDAFSWGDAVAVHGLLMERMELPQRKLLVTLLLESNSVGG